MHFGEALRIKPRFLDARLNLASALMDTDALSDARTQLDLAYNDRDAAAFPLRRIGMLFARCGAPEQARACFAAHASLYPADREIMASLLAWIGSASAVPAPSAS